MTKPKPTYHIAYDCELRKVGCVILQVALGGTVPSGLFWKYFGNCNSWIVGPTPGLKLYPVTEDMLPTLAAKTDFERTSP